MVGQIVHLHCEYKTNRIASLDILVSENNGTPHKANDDGPLTESHLLTIDVCYVFNFISVGEVAEVYCLPREYNDSGFWIGGDRYNTTHYVSTNHNDSTGECSMWLSIRKLLTLHLICTIGIETVTNPNEGNNREYRIFRV